MKIRPAQPIHPAFGAAAVLAAALFHHTPVRAADVLFVDNETPHASWKTLVESGGHTYTLFDTSAYNLSLNNQANLDYVNSFDVIVMSGSNANFNAVRTHGAVWNTQPTPMINLGNYLISGQFQAGSWQWTTPGTGTVPNASGTVHVLAPADPIWNGVPITPGTPPTVALYSLSAGHINPGANTFRSGITTVAAQSSNNANIAIAHADPGALRTGSQEQYFIASMTGGANQAVPFTDAGKAAFLKAIDTLVDLPGPPEITLLSPASGLAGVPLAADLVATFSRRIELTGTGIATIRNLTAGSESDEVIDLPDPRVTTSSNRLTISPAAGLALDTHYAVRISGDAIVDEENNPFAGILNDDDWHFFTTPDSTPPTLTPGDIVDDKNGGPVEVDTWVTYTVTFSEEIDPLSISIDDFGNAGTSAVVFRPLTTTGPGVFRVEARPTTPGTLRLMVLAGAVITDLAGNPLDTSSAILDDTTIQVFIPNDYGNWIDGFGLAPAQKDFTADPDGDGIANGLESWFGTSPAEHSTGLMLHAADGLTATLTHPINPDPPDDVEGFYQWSPDLTAWYPDGHGPEGGATVSFDAVTIGDTATVTATASEELERLFVRAGVTRDVSVADLQRDFRKLDFGMFIHYNMATYHNVEWVSGYPSPSTFNPAGPIDTDAWADAAVSAGMTYGVLTAKHVSGFCLWDSALTTYDVMHPDCPVQEDIVAKFIKSFNSRGLKAGIYYCWRHPGFNSQYKVLPPECDPATHTFQQQIAFQKAQIAELLEKFPQAFYIWNDAYDSQVGPADDLLNHIRGIKPDVLACGNWWNWGLKGTPYLDIAVMEQNHFPPGNEPPGETCWHLEQNWFWKSNSAPAAAQTIVNHINTARSRNSNFLLNVGPDPNGNIIPASVQRLAQIGDLLRQQEE